MSLYQRLHEANQVPASHGGGLRRDPIMDELRLRIHTHLIEELGPILYDNRLSGEDLRRRVHEQLLATLAQERAPLSAADKAQLIQEVTDDILGYGPIDKLLRDDNVSELMVNGPDMVYVIRRPSWIPTISVESSTRSCRRSVVASTSRRRWSTPACPMAPV